MASSGLRKMLNLNYFPTQDGVTVLVCPVILWTLKYIVVIFYGRCSLASEMPWHMLLPNVWQMLLPCCVW